MIIRISSGTGIGPTKLAAFDAALNEAGIANYNLIRLSSVIPEGTKIQDLDNKNSKLIGKWGDRLYVVMAEMRVNTTNVETWAGIGWVQDKDTGKGLFVEHEGNSKKSVVKSINESLKALMATRGIDYSPINMKIAGITCNHDPVCALVVATYQASDWDNIPYFNKK
jgi:arginine decarboxylase